MRRKRVQAMTSDEPSMTKQEFAESTNINNILARYQKTGVIEHYNTHKADYGFADSFTFTEAEQLIARAKSMFEELPSQARQHFDNDPAKFLQFTNELKDDDASRQEMITLGLLAEGAPTVQEMQERYARSKGERPAEPPASPPTTTETESNESSESAT